MTHILNTHRFRGFKLTFADWLKFSVVEELTNEIDACIQEKFLSNDALDLMKPRLLGHICLVESLFQGSYTSIFITYS
jgi:hypothetical protein